MIPVSIIQKTCDLDHFPPLPSESIAHHLGPMTQGSGAIPARYIELKEFFLHVCISPNAGIQSTASEFGLPMCIQTFLTGRCKDLSYY